MKTEVKELLERLFALQSLLFYRRAFTRRTLDAVFIEIADLQLGEDAIDLTSVELIWLGFEILTDSKYLEGQYR